MCWAYYHSKSIGASNKTRLNDPEVDALIDQAAATTRTNEASIGKILEELTAKLNIICSQAPLYQDTYAAGVQRQFGGRRPVNAGGYIPFEDDPWAG